jgi:Zn-dependent metalloprotease
LYICPAAGSGKSGQSRCGRSQAEHPAKQNQPHQAGAQVVVDMKAFIGTKSRRKPKRKVYDCQNTWEQRVKLVRGEGKLETGDKDADQVYEFAGNVRDYFNKVLGRNSIDNSGMDLILNVHFGEDYMTATVKFLSVLPSRWMWWPMSWRMA